MRSHIWLRVAGVDQQVWSFPLDRDTLLIGRHHSCDLKIVDEFASRYHARIERTKVSWHIIDQGSTNGTYLNGERIKEAALGIGDKLKIGHTNFIVAEGTEKAPVPEPDHEDRTPLEHLDPCAVTPIEGNLTEKEAEVLALLAEGLSQKQIAAKLHISRHTVHTHFERLYNLFGVHSQPELMAHLLRPHRGKE